MPNNFTKANWLKGVNLIDAPNMLREGEVQRTRQLVPYGPRGLLSSRPNAAYDVWLGANETLKGNYTMASPVPLSQEFKTLYPTSNYTGDLSFHSFSFIEDPGAATLTLALGAQGSSGNAPIVYDGQGGNGNWRRGALTQMPICVNYLDRQLWFSNQRNSNFTPVGGGNYAESYAALLFQSGSPNGYARITRESLAGANNGSVKPAGACKYRERLVLWGLGPGMEDYIAFTDNNSMVVGDDLLSTDINNPGRNYQVGSDGVPIVSCIEVMLSAGGTPAQSGLLVLKATGAYLVTSEPNQTADTTYFEGNPAMQTIRFNVDATCLSHHTVVRTPYGIVWCGVDDIWVFKENMVPFRIGTKLNPTIRACAVGGYGWKASAEFYAGMYRLQLPSLPYVGDAPGSLLDGFEQYWLELRNGMPQNFEDAAWFGPQVYGDGFGFGTLCAETRPERARYMYLLRNVTYQSGGTKWGVNSVTVDANRSGQDVFASAAQVPLYQRVYNYPEATLITGAYDFGDSLLDKVYTGTELALKTAAKQAFSVQASMNFGVDSAANTDILVNNTQNSYVTSLAYPPDSQRPLGQSIILSLYQQGGYIIDATCDRVNFFESGSVVSAIIAQGRYASLSSLLTAICAAMTAVSTNARTYTHNQASRSQYVTITGSAGTFAFNVGVSYPVSTALLAFVGYAQTSFTPAISQTANTEVGTAPAYPFDLDSVILRSYIIPRRPAV